MIQEIDRTHYDSGVIYGTPVYPNVFFSTVLLRGRTTIFIETYIPFQKENEQYVVKYMRNTEVDRYPTIEQLQKILSDYKAEIEKAQANIKIPENINHEENPELFCKIVDDNSTAET